MGKSSRNGLLVPSDDYSYFRILKINFWKVFNDLKKTGHFKLKISDYLYYVIKDLPYLEKA